MKIYMENFTNIENQFIRYIHQLSVPIDKKIRPKNLLEVSKIVNYDLNKMNIKEVTLSKNNLLLITSLTNNKVYIEEIKNYTLVKILADVWNNSKDKNYYKFNEKLKILISRKSTIKGLLNNNIPTELTSELKNGIEKYKLKYLFKNENTMYYTLPKDVLILILQTAHHIINSKIIIKTQIDSQPESKSTNNVNSTKKYNSSISSNGTLILIAFFGIVYYCYMKNKKLI